MVCCFRKWKIKRIEERIPGRENIRARVQRNSDPVEKTKGTVPMSEAANPCPQTWIAEKTCTHFFVSQQAEFLCVGCKEVATQLAHQGNGEGERGLVEERMTSSCCSISRRDSPSTKRVGTLISSHQWMRSIDDRWLWNRSVSDHRSNSSIVLYLKGVRQYILPCIQLIVDEDDMTEWEMTCL